MSTVYIVSIVYILKNGASVYSVYLYTVLVRNAAYLIQNTES